MLVKFRLENYKSFDREQSISFKAGASRNHTDHVVDVKGTKILRMAAIFGANASGKSNLIQAMRASQMKILHNIGISPGDYCRMIPGNDKKPTSFEYIIEIEGTFYSYGFEILLSSGEVKTEWMKNLSDKSQNAFIFFRDENKIEPGIKLTKDEEKYFFVYSNEVMQDRTKLFLNALSRMPDLGTGKLALSKKIFFWFVSSLRIILAGEPSGFKSEAKVEFTGKVIQRYGTGVSGMRYEQVSREESQIPRGILEDILETKAGPGVKGIEGSIPLKKSMFHVRLAAGHNPEIKKILFDHYGVPFEYGEESDGTSRLMELLPMLDESDSGVHTYVIDELDRSLHPQLTQKIVRDFGELDPKLKRQLIVTTHESRLMDLSLLRRDEIWFVEKKEDGTSEIYSLEAFSERKDRRIGKAYLDGRYGAVPCFREFFPDLE
ncbi:MAG: AAA family ATPase [Candidatus Methanomethylophilaceae archaeon]|jgi:AAA15 family ATPase/GTPase